LEYPRGSKLLSGAVLPGRSSKAEAASELLLLTLFWAAGAKAAVELARARREAAMYFMVLSSLLSAIRAEMREGYLNRDDSDKRCVINIVPSPIFSSS
jgi:hypothetical protein